MAKHGQFARKSLKASQMQAGVAGTGEAVCIEQKSAAGLLRPRQDMLEGLGACR
jgi:hypothetical protein